MTALAERIDEWDTDVFPFHSLDYVPSGYGGILAPYIETGPGTMRAACALMKLEARDAFPCAASTIPSPATVVCDLGCGDGEFLIGLLGHCNTPSLSRVGGVGVDYDPSFITTAGVNSVAKGESVDWITYDFNADLDDLVAKLLLLGVTHVFTYLVPKQLALLTVRTILMRLWESGVSICCHKFQPLYFEATRTDVLMDLAVYEKPLGWIKAV